MLGLQHCEFVAGVSIPSMDAAVARSGENELGVGAEGGFKGDAALVRVTCSQEISVMDMGTNFLTSPNPMIYFENA